MHSSSSTPGFSRLCCIMHCIDFHDFFSVSKRQGMGGFLDRIAEEPHDVSARPGSGDGTNRGVRVRYWSISVPGVVYYCELQSRMGHKECPIVHIRNGPGRIGSYPEPDRREEENGGFAGVGAPCSSYGVLHAMPLLCIKDIEIELWLDNQK